MSPMPNHWPALDAAMSISLHSGDHWRRASEAASSHSKVLGGRQVIAQDKRSAVLGQSTKMNSSLFSKLCWPSQHDFEKREINGGAVYPGRRPRRPCPGLLSGCPSGAPDKACRIGGD
jgi:hypothetical protein